MADWTTLWVPVIEEPGEGGHTVRRPDLPEITFGVDLPLRVGYCRVHVLTTDAPRVTNAVAPEDVPALDRWTVEFCDAHDDDAFERHFDAGAARGIGPAALADVLVRAANSRRVGLERAKAISARHGLGQVVVRRPEP